jgi:hypothetical protein
MKPPAPQHSSILHFAGKDFATIPHPHIEPANSAGGTESGGIFQGIKSKLFPNQGPRLGVYRFNDGKTPGKWVPHEGLVFCRGKSIPVTPETRPFWGVEVPEYGTAAIKNACESLDQAKIKGGLKTQDARAVNLLFGREEGEELNGKLDQADKTLQDFNLPTIDESVQKHRRKLRNRLMITALEIASGRLAGSIKPITPATVLLAILIATPLVANKAHADTVTQQNQIAEASFHREVPHLGKEAGAKAKRAYAILKEFSGKEIKQVFNALPPKERLEVINCLPDKIMPKFLPKALAEVTFKNLPNEAVKLGVEHAGEEAMLAGFEKMTPETLGKLTKLVKESAQSLAIASSPEFRNEIAQL